MIEVNAMGQACPIPVIMAKKAVRENTGTNILVRVDNEAATQNLSKMASQLGIGSEVKKVSEKEFTVLLKAEAGVNLNPAAVPQISNGEYAVVINSDQMGAGDEGFGKKLLEGFIYALTEQDVLPKFVICYNSGVKLTTQNEKTVNDLKALASQGCEVLSCGLCLDFYGLKEKLQVGSPTNMYRITEIMRTHFVVRP
ncbi:sulfurtransferase-like selenium metabolism protein YedF [Treponema putidum]|uniref:Sulfurtransferase-like selenium metabolism protein YedF n=1 Tax=Treponema putidum TaxID=221027 RepID=A0AAE9MQ37_9SPIR|nr:sulfurtransferase-like selenium metabolism protein YedF [Treponema putidum]AIN93937.1 SirA family protein [Treponema putidum]TWI78073.1 selenium metabolism protein YedF [Treponema putidum]UTY27873.1 sulfurtransferase-like selenium metabolism protein YedF [Treponema putidum]UTY30323.1 sulfurtransferase-like selenium metabolism protein YedF [Treponema putidum]UTY32785.1 sulfurtransferase-like selenium metabolism protein YedF [Treponema putidum]